MQRNTRIEIKTTEKTAAQITELQRLLSEQIGTKISKTAAIEIAIDKLLDTYTANPEQARLI